MGAERQYKGTSHFFEAARDHEFVTGLNLRIRGDDVEAAIRSAIEPGREQVLAVQGMSGRGIRELLALMEREDWRARRQAGEFAIPKPRPEPDEPAVCPECGGLGGNEDDEGNWIECERCSG